MGYLKVILDDQALMPEGNIPDRDTAAGVSRKEPASVAELETIRMNLIEDGTFSRCEVLVLIVSVLNFALRSHDQSKGFIVELISLVNAWFGSHCVLWSVHHRQFLDALREVTIEGVKSAATPDAHSLIETGRGDDELPGGAITCIRMDLC